jgi:peptidoglycan/LPS O-acetylase OafA/YrhL
MGVALAAFAVWLLAVERLDPGTMVTLALPFATGMALYVWRDRVRLSLSVGAGLAALALTFRLAAPLQPAFHEVFAITLTYWVFLIGYLPKGRLLSYNRLGDFSYGFYIYAFPVQQLMVYLGPTGMTPMQNILLATPITLICAIMSWNLVERPALTRWGKAHSRAAPR